MAKKQIPSTPDTNDILHQIAEQIDPEYHETAVGRALFSSDYKDARASSPTKPTVSGASKQTTVDRFSISTEQIVQLLLVCAGIGFSGYNVYQSFQIKKSKKEHNLRWISIAILVIFIILMFSFGYQLWDRK